MCDWLKVDYALNCDVAAPSSGSSGSSGSSSGGSGSSSGSSGSSSGGSSGTSGGGTPAKEEVSATEATAALKNYQASATTTLKSAAGFAKLEVSKQAAIDEAIKAYEKKIADADEAERTKAKYQGMSVDGQALYDQLLLKYK